MDTKEILQGIKDWAAPKVIYDISAAHNNTKYTDLSDALGTDGSNIQQEYRKGGITVRFVRTSDNKYIQARCMAQNFTTNIADWQGVDDEPTAGSDNLIKSGRVFEGDADNTKNMAHIISLIPFETVDNKYLLSTGEEKNSNSMQYNKYRCQGNKLYTFSASLPATFTIHILFWLDDNSNIIKTEPYRVTLGEDLTLIQQGVKSPSNAAYAYLNVVKKRIEQFSFNQVDVLASDKINKQSMQVAADISVLNSLTPVATVSGKYINNKGVEVSSTYTSYRKYAVTEGGKYTFSGKFDNDVALPMLIWADNSGAAITVEYEGAMSVVDLIVNRAVIAPHNAAYVYLNIWNSDVSYFDFCSIGDAIIRDSIDDVIKDISEINILSPSSVIDNSFFIPAGAITQNDKAMIDVYDVTEGKEYYFSGVHRATINIKYIAWADENGNFLYSESYGGGNTSYIDQKVIAPSGAHYAWLNVIKDSSSAFTLKTIGDVIKSQQLQNEIDAINTKIPPKPTKVVIPNLEGILGGRLFYLRTKYNDAKDIIITHRTNYNGLVSFENTYIGDKSLSDTQLMESTYLVSSHTDSTAPLYSVSDDCPYWATYAQHGYPIPTIANNANMDATDVGAEWQDQLNRHYTIGKVTTETIYLLPVIYVSGGRNTRDWNIPTNTDAITSLTYVSGGSAGHHTTEITAQNYSNVQLKPIMTHTRRWVADGKVITEPGTYYCDEFSVSESQIGYDPATISDWFGGENGNPDLTGADITAKFTFSYNYKGAQCAMNTTIAIYKEVICDSYGAIQQQFFYDKGDYKAMFMIPKAKAQNGVELDKPFNSPSSSARNYSFYRTSDYIKDIDELIDRQIGFLYNPNTDDYLVGMVAGLSLVSGDTIKTKRLSLIPQGDKNMHYRLNGFSAWHNNGNKFYIAAFNTAPYEANGYYLPTTFFKEINCYVCYFDPAENVGQVYWYKDGNSYVIYAHCQSVQSRIPINVPDFMEGLNLTIVEKTSNTDLLTDTIQNGKIFVNYNTNDANYIVLKAD